MSAPEPAPHNLTPRDLIEMMLATSRELDGAQNFLVSKAREEAEASNEYRKAAANAYLASSGTVEARKAYVDKTVADDRFKFHLAEGLHRAAQEAVRNKRQQLSALQSIANAVRAEFELAHTGPQFEP